MRPLLSLILAFFCFAAIQPTAHAAKIAKAGKASKERRVLMPQRVPEDLLSGFRLARTLP
jgi:hypothetical protein